MMKKLLFSLLLCISVVTVAQTFHSEDFNTLTLGDVNTNFDFTAPGNGGFFTFANNGTAPSTTTNAGNANFQITVNGEMFTNALTMVGPDGSDGFRQIQQPGYDWTQRTAGNDIIEAEISFNTGSNTAGSNNVFRWIIRSFDGTTRRTMSAIEFDSSTNEIQGLATLNNGGTEGLFAFNLGASDGMGGFLPLIAPANTWVRIGISYTPADGRVRWKTDFMNRSLTFTGAANVITNQIPDDFIIIAFDGSSATATPPVTNAAAKTVNMDNMVVRATATDQLLGIENNTVDIDFRIFPNPVVENFTLTASNSELISNIVIHDMSGKMIYSQSVNSAEFNYDATGLQSGIYLIEVSTQSGAKETIKLIKR